MPWLDYPFCLIFVTSAGQTHPNRTVLVLPSQCPQPDEVKGFLEGTGSLCKSYAEKSGVSNSMLMCPTLCPKDAEYSQSSMQILIIFHWLKWKI